jgi:hypothetical protein
MSYHRHLGLIESNLDAGVRAADPALSSRGPFAQSACIASGNAATAKLDEDILGRARDWHPTGYYSYEQIKQIVGEATRLMAGTVDKLNAAPFSTDDARAWVSQARKDLARYEQRGLEYTRKAYDNKIRGIEINDVPGLKNWVVMSMTSASNALVTASVLDCNMPFLASAAMWMHDLLMSVWRVISGVVGFTYEFVIAAGKKVGKILDAGATALQYAMYGLGAVLVYAAYQRLKK